MVRQSGVAAAFLFSLTACSATLGLGAPSERALEEGAVNTLTTARSYELVGSYREGGSSWTVDLQVVRPDAEHIVLTGPGQTLEAIVLGSRGYFRGREFLSEHMGNDPVSRNLVQAAGDSWWNGPVRFIPRLPDLTDGARFRAAFLGSASASRTDHVAVEGVDAVLLSGSRADVYIAWSPPYPLLRVRLKKGIVVDNVAEADLLYRNYNHDFAIKAPTNVVDFSNLSALPPLYTVVSVDTSGCVPALASSSPPAAASPSASPSPSGSASPSGSPVPSPSASPSVPASSPCVVSALVKNLGGLTGARAPSTVTFTMTDPATRMPLGSCQATVEPDVGYNATTTVSCTMADFQPQNGAVVTATPANPGAP